MAFLRANRLAIVLVTFGAIVTIAVGLGSRSTTAVVYTGGAIGVLVGAAIAAGQRGETGTGKKKRRP